MSEKQKCGIRYLRNVHLWIYTETKYEATLPLLLEDEEDAE